MHIKAKDFSLQCSKGTQTLDPYILWKHYMILWILKYSNSEHILVPQCIQYFEDAVNAPNINY